MFRSSEILIHLTVPNSPLRRFVGFLDTHSALDPEELSESPRVVGVLQYGPAQGPIQHMVLSEGEGRPRPFCWLESLRISVGGELKSGPEVRLWPREGGDKEVPDFSIVLELGADYDVPTVVLEFPVLRDSVDVEGAVLPEGYEVFAYRLVNLSR